MIVRLNTYLSATFLGALLLSISACTPSTQQHGSFINRLKNRGPVALSTENPYIASNLLVSREMDRSPEMRGFVETKGAPPAIEVDKPTFSSLTLKFYYPESREFYTLEEENDIWIIRGPNTIPRDTMKEVATLTRGMQGEPKLQLRVTSGQFKSAGTSPAPIAHSPASDSKPLSPLTPKAAIPKPSAEKPPSQDQEAAVILKIKELSANSTQAELSPKGDLVHYVTYPGETLSMISRWYTHDRANAGRIARVNGLADPSGLKIGDTIVIPSYLLKNKQRLSEEAVTQLLPTSLPKPK